jgi:Protein kinase domain
MSGQIGHYRLEGYVGRGSMAVVYLALDERTNERVALKVVAPELAGDVPFRARFLREARIAAGINHPNILPVYEVDDASGALYVAMRYVPGGDARSLLNRHGPLPVAWAWNIIAQVASALDAAHANGLLHRDVRPANMMLDASGAAADGGLRQADGSDVDHVYLSDFGLSRNASPGEVIVAGQIEPLDYAAPEQIEKHDLDGRTDLYSLACAGFELLCGTPPFGQDQGLTLMYAQLYAPPPSAMARRPDLPMAADAVLATALAKNPVERYPTCGQFAAALQAALGLVPGQPADPSPAAPPAPPAATAPAMQMPGPAPAAQVPGPGLVGPGTEASVPVYGPRSSATLANPVLPAGPAEQAGPVGQTRSGPANPGQAEFGQADPGQVRGIGDTQGPGETREIGPTWPYQSDYEYEYEPGMAAAPVLSGPDWAQPSGQTPPPDWQSPAEAQPQDWQPPAEGPPQGWQAPGAPAQQGWQAAAAPTQGWQQPPQDWQQQPSGAPAQDWQQQPSGAPAQGWQPPPGGPPPGWPVPPGQPPGALPPGRPGGDLMSKLSGAYPQLARLPGGKKLVFGAAAAAVLIVVIVLALVLSSGSSPSTSNASSHTPSSVPSASSSTLASHQAAAVSKLLGSSGATRRTLEIAVSEVRNCGRVPRAVNQMQRVVNQRSLEYRRASALSLTAIGHGAAVKSDLLAALRNSLDADRDYLAWARQERGGCKPASQSAAYNAAFSADSQAGTSKQAFVQVWNPVATKYGMPQESAGDI